MRRCCGHFGAWLMVGWMMMTGLGAHATLLLEDGFSYSAGSNLAADAPWAGGSSGAIKVQAGGLVWSGLADTQPSGNLVQVTGSASTTLSYRNFSSTPVTSGSVYVAFLFNSAQAPSSLARVAGLLVRQSSQFNGGSEPLTLLVSNTPAGMAMTIRCLGAQSRAAKLLALNTTHLIVAKFSFNNGGQASLFLDPLAGQIEPTTPDALARGGSDEEDPVSNVQEVALASPAFAGSVNWSLDTLRVGTEWADVAQWPLPPRLTGPANQLVCAGTPAVFTVTALGSTPLAYQWYTNGVLAEGATDSSYTVLNPGPADALIPYNVVVTNNYGSATSRQALLALRAPPSIVVPPASQIATQGMASVVFRVTAAGAAPLTYQWRAGGVPVAGATRSTWTLTNLTTAAGLVTYDVVVANSCETVTSTPPATLTLPHPFYQPDGLPGFFSGMNLFVTNQPGMNLSAWSSADPSLSITNWTLEGVLTEQPLNDGTGNSRYTINVTPASSPVYYLIGPSVSWPYFNPASIAWITTDDQGNYNLLTGWVTVATNGLLTFPTGPALTGPANQTVCSGIPALFAVAVQGTPAFSYQWLANGAPIANATDSSYLLPSPGTSDGLKSYAVVVSDYFGSTTSRLASLTVQVPPSITLPPAAPVILPGISNATLQVTATGTPPLTYQWRAGGQSIVGATRSSLSFTNPTPATAVGPYDVVIANGCGSVTSAPAVKLIFPHPFFLADGLPGFFSGMNLFTTNTAGRTLFAWSSADPAQSITNWILEGPLTEQPLNDGSGYSRYTINVTPAVSPVYYLLGEDVSWPYANPAPVQWLTTDSFGNYGLLAATVNIRDDGTLVFPTGPAVSGPTDQTICRGEPVVFNVNAAGTPPLSYQWRVNGQPVANGTDSTFVLAQPSEADALAHYAVIVTDYFGPTTSRVATLTIQTPPSVTIAPSTQVVMPSAAAATFTVAVAGSNPLSYQWRADGLAIAGATASAWTVTNAAAVDALKNYDVIVANACGSVTSAPPVQLLFPHAFLPADALPGFFSGENLFTTNEPGRIMYAWSSPDLSVSVTNWLLEGSLSEQPLNDGTGQSRYTINVNPSASPMYYVIGESVSWPYLSPVPVAAITSDSFGNYTLQIQTAIIGADGVLVLPSPPQIEVSPLSQKASVGKTVLLSAVASGTPVLSYQWFWNSGTAVAGATHATLTLTGLTAANAGDYRIVVTNAYGSTTSAVATLEVAALPSLAAQKSVGGLRLSTVGVAGEVYWVEMATNLVPPVIWFPIGTNVAGADGLVQFLDAQGGSGGQRFYRLGSPAVASIAPTLLRQPLGQLALEGTAVDLTALAAGAPALGYQWYLISGDGTSVAVAAATNATLAFSTSTTGNSGDYQLVVSNAYGSSMSDIAHLTVLAPRVLNARAVPGGIQLNCFATAGNSYLLQVATNLIPPVAWTTVSTNLADSRGLVTYLEPINQLGPRSAVSSTNSVSQFFRLLAP